MRFKKQKRHRRAVKFFKTCFGFRPPYKVVCDGTFVLHLLGNRLLPADKTLSTLLGDSVNLFTTKCVIAELKRLAKKHGKSYADALEAALKLMTARCDHDQNTNADACITEVVENNNTEHFFVATQDAELRKNLQKIPGVPLIFGLRNTLLLEQPSTVQRDFVKGLEEERSHMSQSEYKLLEKRTKNMLGTEDIEGSFDEIQGSADENQDLGDFEMPEMQAVRKKQTVSGLGVKDKPQFKRKKAKGPNPLSCKPKKNRENPNPVSRKENDESNDSVKRRRKRKRPRGGKRTGGD